MWVNGKHRRFIAWIATFAILLSALAPTISHAVSAARGEKSLWVEVCSTAGSKLVKVGEAAGEQESSAPAKKPMNMEHCPFCFAHGEANAILPATASTLPPVAGKPVLPSLYYQSPRPLFHWAPAQSRAPPIFS